jgi:hypothetical protein
MKHPLLARSVEAQIEAVRVTLDAPKLLAAARLVRAVAPERLEDCFHLFRRFGDRFLELEFRDMIGLLDIAPDILDGAALDLDEVVARNIPTRRQTSEQVVGLDKAANGQLEGRVILGRRDDIFANHLFVPPCGFLEITSPTSSAPVSLPRGTAE